MSKKVIFYIIFFSVLVVGFYLAMARIVPGFTKSRLPPISSIQPFAFINQDGKIVTDKDVAGKVFVAAYFFTTCKGICPKMNNNMLKVYTQFRDRENFLILSHTSDPDTDSARRLKQYADSMKVNTAKWIFLTGRKDSLYKMARHSYKIDDPVNNLQSQDDDFLHTQFFALVDKNGDVIKIYDGIRAAEVDLMMADIERLLKR